MMLFPRFVVLIYPATIIEPVVGNWKYLCFSIAVTFSGFSQHLLQCEATSFYQLLGCSLLMLTQILFHFSLRKHQQRNIIPLKSDLVKVKEMDHI